jgi:hypothetical protein
MDFNPDEAIAAGWLRAGSSVAKMLEAVSRFSLNRAARIVALDRFMAERIIAKGIAPEKLAIIPPWSHDNDVRFDASAREQFRKDHALQEKFVVMYSGNHSPCHPLQTLLTAAGQLTDTNVVFCFVGGGSEWRKIQGQKSEARNQRPEDQPSSLSSRAFSNIICLPYQPLDRLSSSLSAADLHVVVMGDPFVGLVHPCKIYNVLRVGAPVLYLGPTPSHITDIMEADESPASAALDTESSDPKLHGHYFRAGHGDVTRVVRVIKSLQTQLNSDPRCLDSNGSIFSKQAVLPRLIKILEGTDID